MKTYELLLAFIEFYESDLLIQSTLHLSFDAFINLDKSYRGIVVL